MRRTLATSIPAMLVGSIALSLTTAPAQAATPAAHLSPLGMPRAYAAAPSLRAAPASFVAIAPETAAVAASVAAALRVPAAVSPETYTVQRGDSVSAIASRFGLRTADVLALNGLGWSSIIYPGQTLRLIGASAAPAAPAAPPAAPAPTSGTYVIKAGDTISAIASRNGVSTQSVLDANGLGWSSIIYPGQQITIPGTAAPAAVTPPPAPAPAPVPPAAPAAPASGTYVIRAGDTISAIASRNGVSTQALLNANNLGWSSIIYPGQQIVIPTAAVLASKAASVGLDTDQAKNVQLIIRVGRDLGVPERGIAIALGTAMQESSLRNLDHGDRDSRGLFQQRPSTGWGTQAEVSDPERAARAFYGGPSDPNGTRTRGLLDIPNWQSLTFTQAAQAVQISAYPDAYAKWETPAYAWLAALG